ncbi:MAG: hypothetical protein OXI44_12140 [Bacteroidota bacterium]|nr:hypothetical protein [Bacteroidota bacterium]
MKLTIAELARAVDKSETYVRQHIHRKHLISHKDGRHVSVALDEAVRWAREWGLSFVSPPQTNMTLDAIKNRTARMTVLTWETSGEQAINLFTLIRHRRKDALGLWVSEPKEIWSSVALGHGLRLFSFDAPFGRCQALVDQILNSNTLEIDGLEVHYSLLPNPRRHWAYRDDRPFADSSMRSPFLKHSAEIIEYWSFMAEPRKHWLEVLNSLQGKALPQLASLRFPLDGRSDRVGNLMIAGAQDAVACDLLANRNQTLSLHADMNNLLPEAYRASVWACHSGDEVLRREVPIVSAQTTLELASDVDHIGFAIFQAGDGQCVDLMETFLIMEASVRLELESGPTLHLRHHPSRTTHKVHPSGSVSMINVQSDQDSAELDKGIRRLWLDRQAHERENVARREGNFARFAPGEFDKAINYFIGLLRQDSDRTEPIYFADPYFMSRLKSSSGTQLYLDMFALATIDRPLRILCTKRMNSNSQPWWSNYPDLVTDHVSVRSFRRHDDTHGFHDRYLITPKHEILITHSLSGWSKDGVTFARLPYDIYRTEAERLWSMDIGSTTSDLFVHEIA